VEEEGAPGGAHRASPAPPAAGGIPSHSPSSPRALHAAALALEEARSGAAVTGTRKRLDEALDEAVPEDSSSPKRLRNAEDLFASMRIG